MRKDINDYRILNLTSGDNIIGEVENKSESSMTVYRPFQMKIITMMDQASTRSMFRQEALIMRNWLELSEDQKVTIPIDQVVAVTKPTNNVSNLYDEEKEKEDNPEFLKNLLEKIKEDRELEENEENEDMNYSKNLDEIINTMNIASMMEPEDISEIVQRIINDSINLNSQTNEYDDFEEDMAIEEIEEAEESYDTDKDMFGW